MQSDLYKMDTSLKRTHLLAPRVSVLERFHCSYSLFKFWVVTRFVTQKDKNISPKGYFHVEHYAHSLIHTNLLKKELGQYLLRFFNFGWGQNLNADRQNHLPRAVPTRSANIFWALHISSFTPIY